MLLVFLISQCELRIEGEVRVGTGCGRAPKLSLLFCHWQAAGSAQCVTFESHFPGSAVMSCISPRIPWPRFTCYVVEQGQLCQDSSTQHRQSQTGVLQAKVRPLDTPPPYCGLVVSDTTALQTSPTFGCHKQFLTWRWWWSFTNIAITQVLLK